MSSPIELPVIASQAPERRDAARNRERILCTAARLFAERGANCVSMDEIAAAAGVGKGTLFRRFGSRAALAHAVIDESEIAFQEGFIRGEPPLGPGAPPVNRLIAFGEGRLDFLAAHAEVLAAAEAGPARYNSPPIQFHRLHIGLLLREADPDCDVDFLAEALLGCLAVDFYLYMGEARELELARLKSGWADLVRRVTGEREAAIDTERAALASAEPADAQAPEADAASPAAAPAPPAAESAA
jgi:AcrR family transcriptional regulator